MKKQGVLLLGALIMTLTGCGKEGDVISNYLNSYIEKAVMKESNIESDEEYSRYQSISNESDISSDGYFASDEVDYSVLADSDAIHVTFATNSYISVQYFDDEAMTNALDLGGAYLHADDCIYANIVEVNNPNTDAYDFSGFEVWEFDENGKKKKKLDTESFINGLVYQIPMDFRGKEISIIPLGEYVSRSIELNDYCKDNNGVEKPLAGNWFINGEKITNNYADISPVAPFTVTYYYDPKKYDFVGAVPNYLYCNETDGIVSFEEFSPDQKIDGISVELHTKSGDQEFDPNKYALAHAEIEYRYQGVVIEEPIFIPNGAKIEYEIKEVDTGYWVPGDKKGEIEIDSISEKVEMLVCKQEKVKVSLPQPDKGGTIIYSLDNKVLGGKTVDAFIGSEIHMSFETKNGWSCDAQDGTIYKVSSKEVQRANVNGVDVNDIFQEGQYKPTVTLTLDKNIDVYTEFSITTVDGCVDSLKLEDTKRNKLVFDEKVGTKEDLILSANGGTLLDGEALKVEVQKEAKDKRKETDIQYLTKIPSDIRIPLYTDNSDVVYENVKITVSKPSVVAVESTSVENGSIAVKTTDLTNNRYLKPGDVIEADRKVEVSLSAKNGYYVKGSGKTETYVDTLKYSNYLKEVNSIISKHPIMKLVKITLDATDEYGNVTFLIDNKIVEPGVYALKEEQKLEVSYEITDGKHVIKRETSSFLTQALNKAKSKTKETATIVVTSALDGAKISREMYIEVLNK